MSKQESRMDDKSLEDRLDQKTCTHMRDFMFSQYKIVGRHIDKHKYYQGIAKKDEAIQDFIDKYGWLMREMYCANACPDYEHCKVGHDFIYNEVKK